MSGGKTAVVVPFESSANQRGVGTLSGRDLNAMKKQLGNLEVSLAQCAKDIAARNSPQPAAPAGNLYPVIPPAEQVPVAAKPLPVPTPAPEGLITDVNAVIQTISSIIMQITEVFGNLKTTITETSSSVPVATEPKVAPAVAPVAATPVACAAPASAGPIYSNVLPGMEAPVESKAAAEKRLAKEKKQKEKEEKERAKKEKKEREAKEKEERKKTVKEAIKSTEEDKKTEPVPAPIEAPKVVPPTEEMVKGAHAALDLAIAKVRCENPVDLVVVNDDELYCVQKFRKMMMHKQEEASKNFHKRYDKLCSQS